MSEHDDTAPEHGHGGGGHGIKAMLGKKIGPMPAGVWALGILGGILVAVFVRRNASTADAADPAAAATDAAPDTSSWDQADPGGTNPGVGGSPPIADDGQTDTPTPEPDNGGANGKARHGHAWQAKHAKTNEAWRTHATAAMIGHGYAAGAVSGALGNYLAGEHMTPPQSAIVGATLALCGPPPHAPKKKPAPGGGHHPTTPGGGHGHGHTPPTRDTGQGHHHPGSTPPIVPPVHHTPHPAPHPTQPPVHHTPHPAPHPTLPPKPHTPPKPLPPRPHTPAPLPPKPRTPAKKGIHHG